jgi:hypothetical protein
MNSFEGGAGSRRQRTSSLSCRACGSSVGMDLCALAASEGFSPWQRHEGTNHDLLSSNRRSFRSDVGVVKLVGRRLPKCNSLSKRLSSRGRGVSQISD